MTDSEGETGATSPGTPSGKSTEITPEHRTEWKAILKHTKINKAHQARIAQLACLTVLIDRIERLPKKDIKINHSRKFHSIETEADEALGKAKLLNKTFIAAITEQDIYTVRNPVFKADQVIFQDVLDSLFDKLMDYNDLLDNVEGLRAEALPVPADPSLLTILDAMQKKTLS